MPTISVGRDRLFAALEQTYTEEEFDELCFEYGIELDEVTTEEAIVRKEKHLDKEAEEGEEWIYKIEVPANRYDLLCLEGLARALRIFTLKEDVPAFRLATVPSPSIEKMIVKPQTASIRPFVVCAILRGITFDQARYKSFIDLQDKLHQNLCRKRTLVAIGTHDLDTLQGPFSYEALVPSEIKFVPLKQNKEFNAEELIKFYQSDLKLKKFLHIIENSPLFPVIYDSRRTVVSLPPIINGAHSAIRLETKNVFIECTATDLTKAKIVLNTVVTMFSQYCKNKFEVEPVEVVTPDGQSTLYPCLDFLSMDIELEYVTRGIGISLPANQAVDLLNRMQLPSKHFKGSEGRDIVRVSVPPTRSDILHACDVMEDVAIAYGYNNIPKTVPKSHTQGKQQPLNQFTDLLRTEMVSAGFTEILTFILGSHEENFTFLNKRDDKKTAVVVGNPRGSEFEIVRPRLLSGILKTLGHNKDVPRPVKLFEISDVVMLDSKHEVGAANSRHLAALYCCNLTSGFEVIHGLLDRIMEAVPVKRVDVGDQSGYYLTHSHEPEFIEGRQADIFCHGVKIGSFGIVHPQVLHHFTIPDPCTALELDVEHLLHIRITRGGS